MDMQCLGRKLKHREETHNIPPCRVCQVKGVTACLMQSDEGREGVTSLPDANVMGVTAQPDANVIRMKQ